MLQIYCLFVVVFEKVLFSFVGYFKIGNMNTETRSKTMHMGISIKGVLARYKRKKINFFTNDDGSQCSDRDAREYLKECLAKGWDSFPMCGSEECPDFDHFGKGCPGHYVSNEFEGTKWNNQWARKMWELDLKTLEATFSMTADGLGKIEFVDKIRERLALAESEKEVGNG